MLLKHFSALLLTLVSPAGFQAEDGTTYTAAVRSAWNFDRSDLTPHPAVRFGVLPNGMRYALAPSNGSSKSLSVRLHVDAGSHAEQEREQGYMHLLEHLIFHGSVNLPQGAVQTMLQHQGLQRWSDFNAVTSYDEVVYGLDLPRADRGARETALTLMREISTDLSFNRKTVEAAKTDVVQELSGRDAVQDRIMTAKNAFFFPGTPIARGPVPGTKKSVMRAKRSALKSLYERTYVPRRLTLVVAGDIDILTAETEIKAKFSDWSRPETSPAGRSQPYVPSHHGSIARLFVDPGAPTAIAIAAVEPLGSPDATRRRNTQFLEHLGAEMLNRRLARMAVQAHGPFAGATSAVYDHFSTARISTVEVEARNRDWQTALRAVARELDQSLKLGFSQSELASQLAVSRSSLSNDAAPRTSRALADELVDAIGRGIVFTERGDSSATALYLSRVTLADVNGAFKSAWANPSRLIFVSHNRHIPDAQTAITAVWTGELIRR
jgi:zinc protease